MSPHTLSNLQIGYLFQELVRKFNEQANEEAGDHFTPREVIRLMVQLIFTDEKGGTMNRERALKVVLVVVGLFFAAGIYPLIATVRGAWQTNSEDSTPMMLSLYVTLGVFVLLAAQNPSANSSLIAFTAWSSFAHAAVMVVMAVHVTSAREGLLMVSALLGVVGVALIVLAPAKQSGELRSAASA